MTNTLEPHFDYWKTLGFNIFFDRIFRSDTDHFMKPEKEAYYHVIQQIGCQPDECLFIDDAPANVEEANLIGIHGIVFTDLPNLTQNLAQLGIKIS
jgi:putative hydrolase of the HAD superfamily